MEEKLDGKKLLEKLNSFTHSEDLSKNIVSKIQKNNAVIAGGFALSLYMNEEWYQDIDIWVETKNINNLLRDFFNIGFSASEMRKITLNLRQRNSYSRLFGEIKCIYTLKIYSPDKKSSTDIQILELHKDKTIQQVVENFDLSVCRIYIRSDFLTFILSENVKENISNKMIYFDGVKQSLFEWYRTFRRLYKYMKRGFNFSRKSLVKNINKSLVDTTSQPPSDSKSFAEVFAENWNIIEYNERKNLRNPIINYVDPILFDIDLTGPLKNFESFSRDLRMKNVNNQKIDFLNKTLHYSLEYTNEDYNDFFNYIIDFCNLSRDPNMIYKVAFFWNENTRRYNIKMEEEKKPLINSPIFFISTDKVYFYKYGLEGKESFIVASSAYSFSHPYNEMKNRDFNSELVPAELKLDKCYDTININYNADIVEYLRSEDSLSIIFNNTYNCLKISQLIDNLYSVSNEIEETIGERKENVLRYQINSSIYFNCIDYKDNITNEDKYKGDPTNIYILIRLGNGNFLVPYKQYLNMIELFMKKKTRFFKLEDRKETLQRTSSHGFLLEMRSFAERIGRPPEWDSGVGADHCQDGTSKEVYNLIPIMTRQDVFNLLSKK